MYAWLFYSLKHTFFRLTERAFFWTFFFHSAEVVCIYFFQNHPSPPRGLIHLVTWRTWSTVSSLCQNTYVNYLKLSWKNAQNISKQSIEMELCNPRFNIKKPTLGTWQGYHFSRMIYRRVSFSVLWNLKGPQRFGPRVGISRFKTFMRLRWLLYNFSGLPCNTSTSQRKSGVTVLNDCHDYGINKWISRSALPAEGRPF